MCCFTAPMNEVRDTKIFADRRPDGRQLVVYEMTFDAREDALAMVLPIPVAPGAGERAVDFIDLTREPGFFERLWRSFALPEVPGGAFGSAPGGYRAPPPLEVHQVGVYEASFVPSRADFGRLDPRFRLPERVLESLARRTGQGFVVVKLAAGKGATGMHPLAFAFPSSDPSRLFYPTVHAHDGEVHADAVYDHALYGTDLGRAAAFGVWGLEDAGMPALLESTLAHPHARWDDAPARTAIGKHDGGWLITRGTELFRADVRGKRRNADTWLELGGPPTDEDIVAAIVRAADAGRAPGVVQVALQRVRASRLGILAKLRAGWTSHVPPSIEVLAVEPVRRSLPGVFRVHAENAHLRRASHVHGAGSILCALNGPGHVVALDAPATVAAWAGGKNLAPADRAWLDDAAG